VIRSLRGVVVVAGVAVVLLAVAIPVGRWERSHAIHVQQQKIEAIAKLAPHGIGPRHLAAFRLTPTFDCLLYRVGQNPYAIELCFDGDGGLVEAIDRRDEASLRIGSLRNEPEAAPIRIKPSRLVQYFRGISPLKGIRLDDHLPLGFSDIGPLLYERNCDHCLGTG
jgi:hypothetical protein